jgi:signal transduction histidine kinase
MKRNGTFSLQQEQLDAERQQALIRLLLTLVTAVVLLKFYTSQGIPGYDDQPIIQTSPVEDTAVLALHHVIILIALFATYSIGMWVAVRFFPRVIRVTNVVSSFLEIILITFLLATTGWTGIPFYLWYIFYVVSVATRYGWLRSILALGASVVSFAWVAGVPQNSASDVVPVLGFMGFLLVLALMFGQISEKQINYRASLAVVNEFRAELAGLSTSRDVIDHLINRASQLLNVEQAFFLPAKRGADGSEGPGLRSVGSNSALLATFRETGGVWNVEQVLKEQRPLVSNNLSFHNPLPKGEAAKLGIRNLTAAPLIVRGSPVGVVYAANGREKRLNNSDMQLLSLVATQAAPVLENALLWERLTQAATSEERLRIARDLHDNFLQTLAAIKLHLERCKILVEKNSDRTKEGIDKIHQIATRGLAEVRYYLSELRLMGPEPSRFQEAIKRCADEAAVRGGLRVEVDIDTADHRIPPGVAVSAFQIVRELLNNVVNHSHAKNAAVNVRTAEDRLILEIVDDGVGFEVDRVRAEKAAAGHLGLVGVEERAQQSAGSFEITSEPGGGTKATAYLSI